MARPPVKPANIVLNEAHPLARGLYRAYPFLERGGGILHDVGPNAHHGTFSSSTYRWGVGPIGPDKEFTNGGTDSVACPNWDVPTGSVTVSAWIVVSGSSGDDRSVVGVDDSGASLRTFQFRIDNSGAVPRFIVFYNGGSVAQATGTALSIGKLVHMVGTNNKGTAKTALWIDGVKVAEVASGAMDNDSTTMFIGSRDAPSVDEFWGFISDIRVWDRALAPSEILDLYTDPWAMYTPVRRSASAEIADVEFTATSAAVGTTAGMLALDFELSATSNAVSTTTGTLSRDRTFTATSNAVSTTSGVLVRDVPFTATSNAVVTTTGVLTLAGTVTFTATSNAVVTTVGLLVRDLGFVATTSVTSNTTGVLTVTGEIVRTLPPLKGSSNSVLVALTGSGTSILPPLTGSGVSVLPAISGGSVLDKAQDFEIVRGMDVKQPFSPIVLDQGRTLDGTETWKWHAKLKKTDSTALISKDEGDMEIDGSTYEPTLVLVPTDTPTSNFPNGEQPVPYWHGLEMTKGGKNEPQLEGKMIVVGDVVES